MLGIRFLQTAPLGVLLYPENVMLAKAPIYFHITDVVEHAIKHPVPTGVQRSVVRILESIVRRKDTRAVYGLLQHPISGEYRAADLSFLREPSHFREIASSLELASNKDQWMASKLRRYESGSLRYFIQKHRMQLQWASSPALRARVLKSAARAEPSPVLDGIPAPGGYIVTLGSGRNADYHGLKAFAETHGCQLISFVHDIIALSGEPYASDKSGRDRKWIEHVVSDSALIFCNSRFTKKEFERYLDENDLLSNADVVVARFPHEFRIERDAGYSVRDEVSCLLREDFVLCVGTMTTRKNTLGLLEAWQQLEKSLREKTPSLVLAGGEGRGADEIHAFLRKTASVNGTVQIVAQPNDAELELLYRHCRFTVFPSWYEGWGLPVGESLWFGKPVICAARASMPEVGLNFATYFDHGEPASLLSAIQKMIEHPAVLPPDIRDRLTTWDDTADSIWNAIGAFEERKNRHPSGTAGCAGGQ
ncbi:glycosyltransferase family 4 protein [Rhodomicrobium sp.]|uniref:glycosyltransferase family 4 protein n=1 Tax=Rhodomicrobium sp. TaxID=2720632 RepID=UPI0039E46088